MEEAILSMSRGVSAVQVHLISGNKPGTIQTSTTGPIYHVGLLGLHAVCQYIQKCGTICCVTFSCDNAITIENNTTAMSEILHALEVNQSVWSLTLLHYNVVHPNLGNALRQHPGLKELILQDTRIERSTAVEFTAALREAKGLESLIIHGGEITDDAVPVLLEALDGMTAMQTLILAGCGIGPEDSQAIFGSILRSSHITRCELGRNSLGDVGLQNFAGSVGSLVHLALELNSIGDEGAQYIADYLKSDNKMRYLNLRCNRIRCSGAIALCDSITGNPNSALESMNLDINYIEGPGLRHIASVLRDQRMAPKLHSVECQGNSCHDEAYQDYLTAHRERTSSAASTPRFLLGIEHPTTYFRLAALESVHLCTG
eukprot:PhF_6_TR4280/c0_g1_i1/m.5781